MSSQPTNQETPIPRTLLLTGASGFVGGRLWPILTADGHAVRCLSRDPDRARKQWPEREWVKGNVDGQGELARALEGCDAAYFLVHGMSDRRTGFRERERAGAERFAQAAERAGLARIVYLGGLDPGIELSEHLASRLEVGEVLRAGRVPALELRASMIVGYGSLSWQIVRDLAARLPAMVLPSWLKSRTEPVGIRDVVLALARGLDVPLAAGAHFDLPGPEALPAREILERTAALLGLRKPLMIEVPVLSPWLSSHWVRWVSRAEWSVARELVAGLTHDLLATDHGYWDMIGLRERLGFDDAAAEAIEAERAQGRMSGWGRALEGIVARVCRS